jgi:hypothetical protein
MWSKERNDRTAKVNYADNIKPLNYPSISIYLKNAERTADPRTHWLSRIEVTETRTLPRAIFILKTILEK